MQLGSANPQAGNPSGFRAPAVVPGGRSLSTLGPTPLLFASIVLSTDLIGTESNSGGFAWVKTVFVNEANR